MAKWFQTFFLLAAKLYMLLVLLRPSKIPLQPDAISPQLEPENICEYILDFTARFGSVRRESMKKNVKSSIFRKKTSKFLSSLPFKM